MLKGNLIPFHIYSFFSYKCVYRASLLILIEIKHRLNVNKYLFSTIFFGPYADLFAIYK